MVGGKDWSWASMFFLPQSRGRKAEEVEVEVDDDDDDEVDAPPEEEASSVVACATLPLCDVATSVQIARDRT